MTKTKCDFPLLSFYLPLLALVLLMLSNNGARASAINDCIDACFGNASCAYNEAQGQNVFICQSARDRCVKQCEENVSRGTEAPRITGAYGALAYDKKTGAWGMADAAQNRSSAKESALAYCGKRGADCEIVESFSKTCAAVASGTGNRLGWALDDNPRQAGLEAIKKCGESGVSGKSNDHSRCYLQLYHCYSSNGD